MEVKGANAEQGKDSVWIISETVLMKLVMQPVVTGKWTTFLTSFLLKELARLRGLLESFFRPVETLSARERLSKFISGTECSCGLPKMVSIPLNALSKLFT